MKNVLSKSFLIVLCLLVVTACSQSKEEVWKQTINEVKDVFKQSNIKTNTENKMFKYYKPKAFTVQKKKEPNIILKDDGTTYILFVNPREAEMSRADYKEAKKQKSDADRLTSFATDSSFVYVYLKQIEGEEYELVVSSGNVKLTADTHLDDLQDRAKKMARVVHSVKLK